MPMVPQLCAAEDAAVDLSLHCRHFPAVGRGVSGSAEPDDRQYVADARRYPDVYVRQPGGHAIYFPLLFRMKFRFTNKTLLTSAALGVLLCNLIAPHITFLPLLWLICFIEGMCKIQGTFECMSNIQLWMTPKRDFTVFFPWLHIVILGSIQLSDLITTYLMYHYHWTYMNLFIAGLMLIVLLDTNDLYQAFPVHEEVSAIRHRLAGALRFGLPYLPKSLSSSTMATGMTGGTVRSSVSCR